MNKFDYSTKNIIYGKFFLLCLLLSVITGCVRQQPSYNVQSILQNQYIDTTVDSALTKYYIEKYLANKRSNTRWDTLLDNIHRSQTSTLPSQQQLQLLTKKYSSDLSSIFLTTSILRKRKNKIAQSYYQQELERLKQGHNTLRLIHLKSALPYILFVPGWDYANNGHETNGDFHKVRAMLNKAEIPHQLVAIDPVGGVEENTQTITTAITESCHDRNTIAIASASSGGPATALAIQHLTEIQSHCIVAWVNIAGILRGSPIVDYYLEWPRSWVLSIVASFKSWDLRKIASMSVQNSIPRSKQFTLPNHITVVNYIGIPLSGTVSKWAKEGYSIMQSEGPNDGLTMTLGSIIKQGFTIVEIGRDHFMANDINIDNKSAALLSTVQYLLIQKRLAKRVPLNQ